MTLSRMQSIHTCTNLKKNVFICVFVSSVLLFPEDYFDQQCGGMVLVYSLKNPTYPEYAYKTASGVRCVDIHPHKSYLVAAGFYDGNVAVYNLKVEKLKPVCASSPETGKHMDPVIQVGKMDYSQKCSSHKHSLRCGRLKYMFTYIFIKKHWCVYFFTFYCEAVLAERWH